MFSSLSSFFFPKTCVATKQEGAYLSKQGRKTLHPHPEMCPASHRFSRDFCTLPCYQKEFVLKGIHICFYYGSYLKKLILKLKYYHQKDVINTLVDRVILSIQTNKTLWTDIQKGNVCLSYIPSHRRRKYIEKGYNQSELLAETLAQQLNIPCICVAQKTKYTRSQTKLRRKDRLRNIQGSFSIINTDTWKFYKTIILVDDIVTTGSTFHELAVLIKKVNPKILIWGLVVGRHNG